MEKKIRYALLLAAILLVGYNSVYIRKLSDVKAATAASTFDAAAYARRFLHTTLPANTDKAIDLKQLCQTLTQNPTLAWNQSHAQNNGNDRFFLVKGDAAITSIDSEYAYLSMPGVSKKIALETKYIIGTAARDGSGLINVDDFTTTMEMNTVSEELNKLIRTEVLPPFIAKAKPNSHIRFTAALQIQQNKPIPDTLEITPMILTIQ